MIQIKDLSTTLHLNTVTLFWQRTKLSSYLLVKYFMINNITNESFYDFLNNQQDLNKKELDINLPIGNDFNV